MAVIGTLSPCCLSERVYYGVDPAWWGQEFPWKQRHTLYLSKQEACRERVLKGDGYIEHILGSYVLLYTKFVGSGFTFMYDNAHFQVAAIVQQYLKEVSIPTLDWPARSPDLNPIEPIWYELKRCVCPAQGTRPRYRRLPESGTHRKL